MASVVHITDHVAAGLDLLIEQYKGKPRIAALLTSYLNRVQELEDINWDVLISRLIDDAVGAQLDMLGKLVGQARIESDDELYRLRIRTRILVNRSNGKPDELLDIALLSSGQTDESVEYSDLLRSSFRITLTEPITVEAAELVFGFLTAAKGGGVGATLYFSEDDDDLSFRFADSDTAETDAAHGFGSTDDPATGTGGNWIGCY